MTKDQPESEQRYEERPAPSFYAFEAVLRIALWALLGIQIVVILFFREVQISTEDWFGRLATVRLVQNPAVVWISVFIGIGFLVWLYTAKKAGKLRFWWLGLSAFALSIGLSLLMDYQSSKEIYRAPEQELFENYPLLQPLNLIH